jgi:uncharacterized oxidoreductase
MKSSGNTMLITGGTSGIGLGLAQRFHANGNQVIIAGRRRDLLADIAAQHQGAARGIATVHLDVTDPASIAAAFDEVTRRFPELNVVINNAGIMLPENLLDPAHLEVAEATVATNLLGPIRVLAKFTPFLAAKADAAIINVTTGLAYAPLPVTPTYCATKAGVRSFTESLRVQLADTNVQVIDLVPPAVRTTLMNQTDSPHAMPLEDFLSEVMDLFSREPDATQILVERVKRQRFAEANGNYDEVLAMLSGRY